MAQARYIMIGGFLGAGKTTAMSKLGAHLTAAGQRVGLITNDQSDGLADTRILERTGLPVREITGGCFCCRFNSLVDAASALTQEATPDVFLAEPVGSCTDLKATVSYPLRRLYGDDFTVAPFSVLLDPARAARVLGLEAGRPFSPKVLYVYEKQLEEADIIVINKIDAVAADRIAALRAALGERYPAARVFAVSAREGTGLDAWFAALGAGDEGRADLPIDYDTYAEGEALLGWLNGTALVRGASFDGTAWLQALTADMHARLRAAGVEIAHLKTTLASDEAPGELAVVQATRSDSAPEVSFRLEAPVQTGEVIVNLRAEADPALLHAVAMECLESRAGAAGLTMTLVHEQHFRPGRPVPTHRVVMS